jgi:hypothetical protein
MQPAKKCKQNPPFASFNLAPKVKRLAPSFGGVVRFIPEKYHQRITEFYTF